jgi:hypothetical protein
MPLSVMLHVVVHVHPAMGVMTSQPPRMRRGGTVVTVAREVVTVADVGALVVMVHTHPAVRVMGFVVDVGTLVRVLLPHPPGAGRRTDVVARFVFVRPVMQGVVVMLDVADVVMAAMPDRFRVMAEMRHRVVVLDVTRVHLEVPTGGLGVGGAPESPLRTELPAGRLDGGSEMDRSPSRMLTGMGREGLFGAENHGSPPG